MSAGLPLGVGDDELEEVVVEGEGRAKVLLVDVSGVLTDQPARRAFGLVEEESTVARVEAELRKAAGDRHVRAVVLRIDSPGGGVTASDRLFAEVRRFRQERQVPVVAALGDVAASGGYYVACAADTIVAHPTTITGSIGVLMLNLNVEGLLGKVGIRNETYKAGEHKDILSPLRAATPEERRIVQAILDGLHARFVTVVRERRPSLDQARLADVTDGRILDAQQALAAGLVDRIGGVRDAIATAREAAGVERVRVVTYRRGRERRETVHARLAGGGVQVNVLPVDLAELLGPGARFLYLWAPGLGG